MRCFPVSGVFLFPCSVTSFHFTAKNLSQRPKLLCQSFFKTVFGFGSSQQTKEIKKQRDRVRVVSFTSAAEIARAGRKLPCGGSR